jgi:hypothetical protein
MAVQKDLVVLVADRNQEYAVKGMLARDKSLGIRQISFDIHVHPEKDSGVLLHAHDFLRPFSRRYGFALVLLDKEGSGQEKCSREELENGLETKLSSSNWADRCGAIVIEPELEIWVWSDSLKVDEVLGWAGKSPDLRSWLTDRGYLQTGRIKPQRPKEAMEAALRVRYKPRSSSVFLQLAQQVSLERCADPSFQKFKVTIQDWFGLK